VSRKTIGHRLFGLGRIPKRRRAALVAEGILVADEGIRVDLTLRGYRAPGRAFGYRRQLLAGAIVLTAERIAAFVWCGILFDLRLDDPLLTCLEIEALSSEMLRIAHDAGDLDPRRSGQVECRFRTDRAEELAARIALARDVGTDGVGS